MRTLNDHTPLNSVAVDVASRSSWLMRMARTTARPHIDTRLQTLAELLETSPAHLSRLETGQRRDSSLIVRYEEVLDLPEGALWAPVSRMCRTFPTESPRDTNPLDVPTDVESFSSLTELLLSDEPVSGGVWLAWARALNLSGNIGLPLPVFRAITARLTGELARAVSHAHPTRVEALALLRASVYGDALLDVARSVLERPYGHGIGDIMSGIGSRHTNDAVTWALSLLAEETTAMHGARALECMSQPCSDPDFWLDLATPLLTIFNSSREGSAVEEWSTHLIRLVPVDTWRTHGGTPTRALPAPVGSLQHDASNELWTWSQEQGEAITSRLGIPPQPILARIIFEAAFGPWESRAATASMLLTSLPAISRLVLEGLTDFVETYQMHPVRKRVLRRMASLNTGFAHTRLDDWLHSDDTDVLNTALSIAGGAGVAVPAEILLTAVLDERTTIAARYAAGMAQVPQLHDIELCATLPEGVRRELAWWRDKGGRISV